MTLQTQPFSPVGPGAAVPPVDRRWMWVGLAAAGVAAMGLYSTDLVALGERWATDAGWGHGFVIPLIGCYFIFLKWDTLRTMTPRGSLWGLAILLVGVAGQALFRVTGLAHMSLLSIVVVLYGLTLFVFGWDY